MAKIYIVTSGEYSDYCIQAVFSTMKKAQEYRQQHGTDYSIEVYDVDEEVKKETKVWRVAIRFDNFKVSECRAGLWGDGWGYHMKDTFEYYLDWKKIEYIRLYLEADCMDRAIKIASERIAQIKANKDMLYAKAFTKVQDPFFSHSTSYPTVYYKTGEIMEKP